MACSAWDVIPASKRCSWPSVASGAGFVRRVPAYGPDCSPPGRARHPLGPDAAMDCIGTLPSSYARYAGLWKGARRSSSPYKWVYKAMVIYDNENLYHNMVRYEIIQTTGR